MSLFCWGGGGGGGVDDDDDDDMMVWSVCFLTRVENPVRLKQKKYCVLTVNFGFLDNLVNIIVMHKINFSCIKDICIFKRRQ